MLKFFLNILCLSYFSLCSCQNLADISDISQAPPLSKADEIHAHIFKGLDGTWKGKFLIFEDRKPVLRHKLGLENLTIDILNSRKLRQVNEIDVTQKYTSESPYFQRVSITDYYPDSQKTERSEGVNKIQDGTIWCVVQKPTETIIHKGSAPDDHTLIWQRNEKSPQRIEYFLETVSDEFYEIIGYGYYDGDDIQMSPKLWFHGKYKRQ